MDESGDMRIDLTQANKDILPNKALRSNLGVSKNNSPHRH